MKNPINAAPAHRQLGLGRNVTDDVEVEAWTLLLTNSDCKADSKLRKYDRTLR